MPRPGKEAPAVNKASHQRAKPSRQFGELPRLIDGANLGGGWGQATPFVIGDGGRGSICSMLPKNSGKYFSSKCHIKFGHFANFSYFRATMCLCCPPPPKKVD